MNDNCRIVQPESGHIECRLLIEIMWSMRLCIRWNGQWSSHWPLCTLYILRETKTNEIIYAESGTRSIVHMFLRVLTYKQRKIKISSFIVMIMLEQVGRFTILIKSLLWTQHLLWSPVNTHDISQSQRTQIKRNSSPRQSIYLHSQSHLFQFDGGTLKPQRHFQCIGCVDGTKLNANSTHRQKTIK